MKPVGCTCEGACVGCRGLLAAWDRAVAAYRRLCATSGGDIVAMNAYEVALDAIPIGLGSPLDVAKGGAR